MALDAILIPEIAASFRTRREELWPEEQNPPTTLFHYTSADGLVGIASNRKFFLTDVLSSSDRSEIVYGTDLAIEALREHAHHPLCEKILATYREHRLAGLGES
jgi:hypothetical protein